VDTANLEDEEEEKECSDIRDIDFKLMHNLSELQVTLLGPRSSDIRFFAVGYALENFYFKNLYFTA